MPVLKGTLSLHDYLKHVGEHTAFIVSDILDEQDWAPFEREKSRGHRVYTGANCADCPKKEKCTQAKKGRKIKRYPEDEARDKLCSRMTKPESKRILSQRKVMVEPVFSALRGIQGLERFRRRGLSAVRMEFTLHAIAYNLSRAVALILWVIFSLSWVASPNNRQ
ncbi:transposase [Photorhabdus bodei]